MGKVVAASVPHIEHEVIRLRVNIVATCTSRVSAASAVSRVSRVSRASRLSAVSKVSRASSERAEHGHWSAFAPVILN